MTVGHVTFLSDIGSWFIVVRQIRTENTTTLHHVMCFSSNLPLMNNQKLINWQVRSVFGDCENQWTHVEVENWPVVLLCRCASAKGIFDLGIRIRIHSRDAPIVYFCKCVHDTCKRLPNVFYTNIVDNNKKLMILTWFSVTITMWLVLSVAACNVSESPRWSSFAADYYLILH